MIETPAASSHERLSQRRLLAAFGTTGIVLLIAMLFVLQRGRTLATRHAPLKNAVQIELELMRANLGYARVLNGNSDVNTELVEQHLAQAKWYAQAMVQACSTEGGWPFAAPIAPLRSKLEVLRGELHDFTDMTLERLKILATSADSAKPDPLYDRAFRQLALRSLETKAAADDVIRKEQRVLNTLQACFVISALLLTSGVAVTLFRYVRQRRQVETALRESEVKFRSLFGNSSDAIMLLDENSFLDCNEATLKIFRIDGYEEFCRQHPADLSPPQQPDGSDSLTRANEMIAHALRDGSHRFEWMHQRADGTTFPAEVLLSAVELEERRALQAVVRDVTQRRESEEELRSNQEQLRTISEAALDAVIMMDASGNAVHWNPAAEKMFGYAASEVIDKNIHSFLAPQRLRHIASQALVEFFNTGKGRAIGRIVEMQALRKGGEEFPVEISLAPIRIENSWRAVAVIRDITARKLAEEKLRSEQHTLRRLLKAHDQERKLIAYEIHDGLAQQLVAAIMQCQTALQTGSDVPSELLPDLLELLRQCLSETRRLISGVRPPILDEFGVVTAIHGLLEETEARGGPEIEFDNQITFDRLEPVLENTIYRVIQESLGNACRHANSPRVVIELLQDAEHIEIRVRDWGVGFEPQHVERGRYGLAGIRERARLLGGDVQIDSQPGEGTTVTVKLPIDVGDLSE